MATAAALAKGSVHWVADENVGGVTTHWVTDAGTTQGKQIGTGSITGNCTILVTSAQVAYFRGDTACLEEGFQFPGQEATKYAGQWIAVPSSSSGYGDLVTGLTASSNMTGATPSAPLRFTKPTTIDGRSVIGISGGLGPFATGYVGTQVLYISTAAPYLPVAVVLHGTQSNGPPMTSSAHMSDYGESVVVTEPAHSIPISSIPGTS